MISYIIMYLTPANQNVVNYLDRLYKYHIQTDAKYMTGDALPFPMSNPSSERLEPFDDRQFGNQSWTLTASVGSGMCGGINTTMLNDGIMGGRMIGEGRGDEEWKSLNPTLKKLYIDALKRLANSLALPFIEAGMSVIEKMMVEQPRMLQNYYEAIHTPDMNRQVDEDEYYKRFIFESDEDQEVQGELEDDNLEVKFLESGNWTPSPNDERDQFINAMVQTFNEELGYFLMRQFEIDFVSTRYDASIFGRKEVNYGLDVVEPLLATTFLIVINNVKRHFVDVGDNAFAGIPEMSWIRNLGVKDKAISYSYANLNLLRTFDCPALLNVRNIEAVEMGKDNSTILVDLETNDPVLNPRSMNVINRKTEEEDKGLRDFAEEIRDREGIALDPEDDRQELIDMGYKTKQRNIFYDVKITTSPTRLEMTLPTRLLKVNNYTKSLLYNVVSDSAVIYPTGRLFRTKLNVIILAEAKKSSKIVADISELKDVEEDESEIKINKMEMEPTDARQYYRPDMYSQLGRSLKDKLLAMPRTGKTVQEIDDEIISEAKRNPRNLGIESRMRLAPTEPDKKRIPKLSLGKPKKNAISFVPPSVVTEKEPKAVPFRPAVIERMTSGSEIVARQPSIITSGRGRKKKGGVNLGDVIEKIGKSLSGSKLDKVAGKVVQSVVENPEQANKMASKLLGKKGGVKKYVKGSNKKLEGGVLPPSNTEYVKTGANAVYSGGKKKKQWTAEERKAFGAKMKALREAKKKK